MPGEPIVFYVYGGWMFMARGLIHQIKKIKKNHIEWAGHTEMPELNVLSQPNMSHYDVELCEHFLPFIFVFRRRS